MDLLKDMLPAIIGVLESQKIFFGQGTFFEHDTNFFEKENIILLLG